MKLTRKQWRAVQKAVADAGFGEPNGALILAACEMGRKGKHAATEGVDPIVGAPRYRLIHALRALVVAASKLQTSAVDDALLRAVVHAEDLLHACEDPTGENV